MHDIDRTSLENNYGEYESDEYGYEFENGYEGEDGYEYEDGSEFEEEMEYGNAAYGESPFSEAEEMELAAELLGVTNEYELDQFIGKLIKRASRAVGRFVKSPIGAQLGGIIKGAARSALPMLGGALGNVLLPGVGGAMGSKLATAAGSMFGLELEGLSQEDQEFEIARQLVRFGGAATGQAVESQETAPPVQAAQSAAVIAAKQYAPGLLRNGTSTGVQPVHRCHHRRSGQWIRRRGKIIVLGV
jgi:hypothetical protein